MEPAGDGLSFSFKTFWHFDRAVEQMVGHDGVELEADSLRLFCGIDQDAIGNGLGPSIGVDEVWTTLWRHGHRPPGSCKATAPSDFGNCP